MPLVQLLRFNPQNSLLTTALVALLVSFLSYSAQISYKTGCTTRLNFGLFAIDIVINIFLMILATFGSIMGGLSG